MTTTDNVTLYTLGDHGQTIDGSANDVRGREVKDEDGNSVGKIADLLVDDLEQKVRFLVVEHGGFLGVGEKKTLLPVDTVTKINGGEVLINQSAERVAAAPGYHPDLIDDRPHHADVYRHYGCPPYWGPGYVYPYPMRPPVQPRN